MYMIAYRVHVYTRASLIHSPNLNPGALFTKYLKIYVTVL